MLIEITDEEAPFVINALNERQGNYINGDGSPMVFPKPTADEIELIRAFNRRLKNKRLDGKITMYVAEEVEPGVPIWLPIKEM